MSIGIYGEGGVRGNIAQIVTIGIISLGIVVMAVIDGDGGGVRRDNNARCRTRIDA